MKKICTTMFVCLCLWANAQYYLNTHANAGMNPGGLNNDVEYPVGSGLDPTWVSIHPSSVSPAWSSSQTIPFAFDFNGSPVTQYIVSNSGVLTFDVATSVTAPTFTNVAVPSAIIPDMSVLVWGIQGIGANDIVVSKTFGTAPYRQHWVFFTSYTFGTFYTYWSIVMEETTNRIFVVDQRSSGAVGNLTVGIQVDGTTTYAVNGGNNNVASLAGVDFTPGDNSYYEFIPGIRPNEDMSAQSDNVANYLILSQAPFSIGGTFLNYGANAINNYDMNYTVNGGPSVSGSIGSLNVASLASTTGVHPTGWTPSSVGTYTISIWANNINGNPDGYNFNDTLDFTVTVVDTLTNRNVCMEVFTSSTCGPCVAGNLNMDNNILPNISNYTVIKYQQDFPGSGDPYANSQSVARRGYYGINSIPRMEIDGQWDLNAQLLTTPIYNTYQQDPAFMEIGIQGASVLGTTVTVNGTIKPLINYPGNNFVYHVIVTEKITYNNVASNGETEFHEVMMKMWPNNNGTAVTSLTQFNIINVNATIPMTGTNVEEYSDLRVVIFVQDNTTKKILQSQWLDITDLNSVAQLDNSGEGIGNVFPNPAGNMASINLTLTDARPVTWTVFNTTGQQVLAGEQENATAGTNRIDIGTAELAEGVYFVNINTGDKIYTAKMIVRH
jgi:Secretion system C-terminal sorting domain